jgi:hypothetical protein
MNTFAFIVKCDASLDENDCATTRPYALDFADE